MSAHLVDTADDESLLLVANHISQLIDGQARSELVDTPGSAFYRECADASSVSDYSAVIQKFLEQVDLIFEKASSADLQTALCVVVHLLRASSQQASFAQQLAAKIASKEDEHAEQRLSVLVDIFNATSEAGVQYNVLMHAVKLATATSKAPILAPALRGNLDAWITGWKLPKKQERDLLLAVAALFRTALKRRILLREAHKLTVRALATLEEADTEELAALKSITVNAVAEFLNSPEVFQFDLLYSPAVAQLENDPETKSLLRVLQTALAGNVKEVSTSLENDTSLQQTYGLSTADLVNKTQLMAIMLMAAHSNELLYSSLKERLQLEDNDAVEDWLVKAIGRRLINGQMDQERQVITILKAAHRAFGPEDWRVLQSQLSAWKASVSNACDLISRSDGSGLNGAHPGGPSWRSGSQYRRPVQA